MAFPYPYQAEQLQPMSQDLLSPFNLSFDLSNEKSKISAWSLAKHIEHRFGTGKQTGPVYFDTTTTISRDLQEQFDEEEEREWVDCLLGAAKRVRTHELTPPGKEKKVYRKTPPFNPSLRTYRASPDSSPLTPSSPLSPASLLRLERTSQSESCAVDR